MINVLIIAQAHMEIPPPPLTFIERRRRLFETANDKSRIVPDQLWMLAEYSQDRTAYHEYLKRHNLVHQDSKMAFDMFFDDSKEVTNKYVFFYDAALTRIVYVAKIGPHPRIDETTGDVLPQRAGNGNNARDHWRYGMSEIVSPSNDLVIIRDMPVKIWDEYGEEALQTVFRPGETRWNEGVDVQASVHAINKRRQLQVLTPAPVSTMETDPTPEAASISMNITDMDRADTPCESTLFSPNTPQAHQLKSWQNVQQVYHPLTPVSFAPLSLGTMSLEDPMPRKTRAPAAAVLTNSEMVVMANWRKREPLKARTLRAKRLKLKAASLAAEVLAAAPITQTSAEKAADVRLAKILVKSAKDKAKELKHNDKLVLDEKKHITTSRKVEKELKAAKKAEIADVPAIDPSPGRSFVSQAFFPYIDHDEAEWHRIIRDEDSYSQLREARTKINSDGYVMRKNDRVFKPAYRLTLTSWKAIIEDDESHFAFLQEKFRLDSRNLAVTSAGITETPIKRKK